MSQLENIQLAQKSLEECFARRMAELEGQIQSAGPAKDTVAKVAEEFRTFRELMFTMLGLLRKQIDECSGMLDAMETRHRRKDLIFLGVAEAETDKDNCRALILDILRSRMSIKDVEESSISTCHRLGAPSKERHRPILVQFASVNVSTAVWRAKTALKGSKIAVKEFLTKTRQSLFAEARQHFGMRSCWTQDSTIVVKAPDGTRSKITSTNELKLVITKHPKTAGDTCTAAKNGAGSAKTVPRKN